MLNLSQQRLYIFSDKDYFRITNVDDANAPALYYASSQRRKPQLTIGRGNGTQLANVTFHSMSSDVDVDMWTKEGPKRILMTKGVFSSTHDVSAPLSWRWKTGGFMSSDLKLVDNRTETNVICNFEAAGRFQRKRIGTLLMSNQGTDFVTDAIVVTALAKIVAQARAGKAAGNNAAMAAVTAGAVSASAGGGGGGGGC